MGDKKSIEIVIFWMLFFFGALFYHPAEYDNTSSRFFLVSAIVDFDSFSIDPYHEWTIDKSRHNDSFYSNKAIGAPLLAIPVYWAARTFFSRYGSPALTGGEKYFIRLLTVTLPHALLGVALFRTACMWGAGLNRALWMVFAYAFGSIAWIHATLFSGHQTAAGFGFISFFILFRLNRDHGASPHHSVKLAVISLFAGLCTGIAALSDYTAMWIALVLSAYALFSGMPWRVKASFFAGGFLCALVLAGYNWACFDHPLSFSYDHLTFGEFKEGAEKGFFGISIPKAKAVSAILVSPSRGLFFIMPVFLLSVIGIVSMWRRKSLRHEALVIIIIVLGYIFINAGFYGWHGGWTFGPRYLVPMLPFLAIPMIFSPRAPVLWYLLLGVSMVQVLPAVAGFPHVPPEVINPIIEFILPCMGYGYTALMGWGMGIWPAVMVACLALGAVFSILFVANRRMTGDGMEADLPSAIKGIFYLWVVTIIILLCVQRTVPPTLVHGYRSRILSDAATAVGSKELRSRADHERRMANLK